MTLFLQLHSQIKPSVFLGTLLEIIYALTETLYLGSCRNSVFSPKFLTVSVRLAWKSTTMMMMRRGKAAIEL